MPIRLWNKPATFPHLMQATKTDLIVQIIRVNVDILVYSKTFEEHLERLEPLGKWCVLWVNGKSSCCEGAEDSQQC